MSRAAPSRTATPRRRAAAMASTAPPTRRFGRARSGPRWRSSPSPRRRSAWGSRWATRARPRRRFCAPRRSKARLKARGTPASHTRARRPRPPAPRRRRGGRAPRRRRRGRGRPARRAAALRRRLRGGMGRGRAGVRRRHQGGALGRALVGVGSGAATTASVLLAAETAGAGDARARARAHAAGARAGARAHASARARRAPALALAPARSVRGGGEREPGVWRRDGWKTDEIGRIGRMSSPARCPSPPPVAREARARAESRDSRHRARARAERDGPARRGGGCGNHARRRSLRTERRVRAFVRGVYVALVDARRSFARAVQGHRLGRRRDAGRLEPPLAPRVRRARQRVRRCSDRGVRALRCQNARRDGVRRGGGVPGRPGRRVAFLLSVCGMLAANVAVVASLVLAPPSSETEKTENAAAGDAVRALAPPFFALAHAAGAATAPWLVAAEAFPYARARRRRRLRRRRALDVPAGHSGRVRGGRGLGDRGGRRRRVRRVRAGVRGGAEPRGAARPDAAAGGRTGVVLERAGALGAAGSADRKHTIGIARGF